MTEKRVSPNQLKPGPIRHEQLPITLLARIDYLRSTLEEVYPLSMAEWVDGFQRDAHPEREVLWWERLARCYVEYISRNELNPGQRKGAFNVICKIGLGASAGELAADLANLQTGALDDIQALIRSCAGA